MWQEIVLARPIKAIAVCGVLAGLGAGLATSAPATQSRAADSALAADMAADQRWERGMSLADELIVQLALAKGLDPERAEKLRDIYQEMRAGRRATMLARARGRIGDDEVERAAFDAARRRADEVNALLTPEERLLLDEASARALAVQIIAEIDRRESARSGCSPRKMKRK